MLPSLLRNSGTLFRPDYDDFFGKFFYGRPAHRDSTEVSWAPRVDINETEKEVTIDAELPGIDKKDVKVEVKEHVLTISGERKNENKSESNNAYKIERFYGKFQRSFNLTDLVADEKITANYKNGVLTLTLPKTEKALPKEIAVEVK